MKKNLAGKFSLRSRVVKFLEGNPDAGADTFGLPSAMAIEELRIHRIELEMQNEDLRLARENAERIQKKYIDLYEFAPVGYLTLGENETIVEANLTAAMLLGLKKSQIRHHPLTDFVDPKFQDVLYFHLAKVIESRISESCELMLKKSADQPFFALLKSQIFCNEGDKHAQIRVSIINIHESKLNAIALKESAERNEMLLNLLPQSVFLIDKNRKVIAANLTAKKSGIRLGKVRKADYTAADMREPARRDALHNGFCTLEKDPFRQRMITIIEDSNDAVCLMDLHGNIKAWNRMAEEIYGYATVDAVKMSVFDLVPARLKQQTAHLLTDISAGILIKPFETKRIAKDGSILDICLKVTRLVQNGNIVAIATTERDITSHNLLFASLQDLPRRIIVAQEEERSRISQVLHSEFGQGLIALKLFLVVASSALPENDQLMRPVFEKIRMQLDKIINDTRTLAHKLSPPGLKYVGLIPAIKELVESAMSEKLQVRFFHNDVEQASFKEKDIIIYRILQEALQNIMKHSGATRVRVDVVLKKTVFILEVNDNGRGFDPSLTSSAKGLGLALMKQQAALIKGRLSIRSRKGKGTLLKVTVPVKEKKVI